jgi:acyl carrier protein
MDSTWKSNALSIIQNIFRDQFLDDTLIISDQTKPSDIEEWDSLAHVNILAAIESAFAVHFTADDMANIDSIGVILTTLLERGAK